MSLTGQQKGRKSDAAPAGRVQPAATRPGAAKGTGPPKMPPRRTWLWFVLVLARELLAGEAADAGRRKARSPCPIPCSRRRSGKGNVQAIYSQGDTITGRFKAPVTYPPAGEKSAAPKGEPATASERGRRPRDLPKAVSSFATTLPSFVGPGLEAFLIDHGVEISAKPIEEGGSPWATLLFGFGPALLFIGFYVWMFRRAASRAAGMGGGLMGIGKSKARRYDQETGHEGHLRRCRRHRRGRERAGRDRGFPQGPPEVHAPGRDRSQRRAAGRPAGDGKDPAGEGGRGRGGGAVLLDERLGVRGDDRGGGGGEGAGPLQAGARARARDHLHRRAGRHRARAGADGDRGLERAGADPEPDPDRDGRVLQPGGHHRAGGDQPAGRARQGAPAARTLRPARGREPPGQDRARGDPQGPHPPGAARGDASLGTWPPRRPGSRGRI